MKKNRRLFLRCVICVVVLLGILFGFYLYRLPRREYTPRNDVQGRGNLAPKESAVVGRVIDGDTIVVGEDKVRLIGIDAPEIGWVDPPAGRAGRGSVDRRGNECFAEEAKEKLKELVEGKEIKLEKDVSEKDKYDRLLRYVYLGEENINEILVREGFAKLATYPPDMKYYGKIKEAQRVAKENRAGLWSYCMDSPAGVRGINSSSQE